MALINCAECSNPFSDKALACPHCGCPVEFAKPQTTTPVNEPIDIWSGRQNITETRTQDMNIEIKETPKTSNNIIINTNISKPTAIVAVGLVFVSLFSFVITFAMLKDSFLQFLLFLILSFVLLGYTIRYINDCILAQKDFKKYQEKVITKRQAEKARKEAELRRQQEYEAKRREYRAKGIPTCPRCGSHSIATINRGYSIVSGFVGSGKPINVCQICGHKWKIGN